jgi:hypothetical protein
MKRGFHVEPFVAAMMLVMLVNVAGAHEGAGDPPPRLFFTDIESGPNTGGQDNLGAFITLWGEGFGDSRGSSTVTIGGQEVARYVTWGQDNAVARKMDIIVVQPGPNVISGNIVVTVNGQASNPLPFTVRSGQIYFVISGAPNADDSNPGTFAQPFKTIYRPRQVMQAGDIVYIKGGTFSTSDPEHPGWDAILFLIPDSDPNGTADRPIAYIGYPGDQPVLGSLPPMRRGILVDQAMAYYIIANLRFTQHSGMLQLGGNGHRVVGNYSYDGIYSYGGVIGIIGNSAHFKIFGNLLRNNGEAGEKLNGHAFYIQGFGTNEDIDFGWNQIQDQRGGRAIQLYGHGDGDRMDNIRIHDNLISGSELNNIVIGGSDGSAEVIGTIHFYNNIVVGSGTEGLRVNDPQGTVYIQNNTFYNNGTSQVYLQRAGTGRVTLQDNILYAGTDQAYYTFESGGATPTSFNASHNLVYNAGDCPVWDAGCINANPLFAGSASMDFRLQAPSPAINAGIDTGIGLDYAGVSRPQGGAYDIGAHEYITSTTMSLTPRVYMPLVLR